MFTRRDEGAGGMCVHKKEYEVYGGMVIRYALLSPTMTNALRGYIPTNSIISHT